MLTVNSLRKEYVTENGAVVQAVRNTSFSVPRGKMFTLLGPSGCGKTTILRCIAGLEKPNAGQVMVGEETIYCSTRKIFVPPNRRNFGMVFQSYAIWPHMTVYENAAFPLRVGRRKSAQEIDQVVSRALHVVALDGLEDRKATQLSGGQQQRLALARALVMEPPLLLLDEPLSNLDAKLRERMRFELKRLQNDLGITTIYVTHDQTEALALSHEIAVMSNGDIVQIGAPKEIYERPSNQFVADFVGTTNLIPGEVVEDTGGQTQAVRVSFGVLSTRSHDSLRVGDSVLVSIRPEHIQLSLSRPDSPRVWEGAIDTQIFLGERQDVQIKIGDVLLQARAATSSELSAGKAVYLDFDEATALLASTDVTGVE